MQTLYPQTETEHEAILSIADYFSRVLSEVETDQTQRAPKPTASAAPQMPRPHGLSFAFKRR